MLNELTKEQMDLFPKLVNKWSNLSTLLDKDKAIEFINFIYSESKLDKPEIIFVDSPLACQYLANVLANVRKNVRDNVLANVGKNVNDNIMDNVWGNVRDNVLANVGKNVMDNVWNNVWNNVGKNVMDNVWGNVRDNVWGNVNESKLEYFNFSSYGNILDFMWCSFYDYFTEIKIINNEKFNQYKKILETGIYDMIQFDKLVIVCGMPEYVKRDENQLLHCDGDFAIKWTDGYGCYFLHGTKVSQELATTPSEKLNIDMFNKIKNADERTEFVRKFGVDRMTSFGKVVDSWTNYKDEWYEKSQYELIDLSCLFNGVDYAPHLKMRHMTMKIFCVEAVSPHCKTIKDALEDRAEESLDRHVITEIK